MGKFKMYGFVPQIMIEKEAIIDFMTSVQKRERKLGQTVSNPPP